MTETYQLIRLWDSISVYISPSPPVKQGPRNLHRVRQFFKKLVLKPKKSGFLPGTIDVKRLSGHFTSTLHTSPQWWTENIKANGLKLVKRPSNSKECRRRLSIFYFTMPPGGSFSISNLTKCSSWTEFNFKIVRVHFFSNRVVCFYRSLCHLYQYTATLHIGMVDVLPK